MREGLAGIRVIDLSTGIAPAYAAKLFVDAGADVVKIEPPDGDPLRRWSATGAPLDGRDGALFRFLHHGVRSVVGTPGEPDIDALLQTADLVIDSAVPAQIDAAALGERIPGLVIVFVTPFGRTGPYADRPATEFTCQAESGCLAGRGTPDRPPIMAGGRIGEWVTGTYAAVAALAAVSRAKRTGHGEVVDVSMLELLNVAGTSYADLVWSLYGRPALDQAPPPRLFETPSIEPTADGWVGFTTNSRQQFDDFLVLIERPDLLGDEHLARVNGRMRRIAEWNDIVRSWTTRHTTAEILDAAGALRIPVAPIGNGATVQSVEQFVERGVFVEDPVGEFLQPRRPWRLGFEDPPRPKPSPGLGEHTGAIEARSPKRPPAGAPPAATPALPLAGIRVLDLTAWWAGPAAAHMLGILGADVIHVESIQRMDGMRMTGGMHYDKPQWWERSAVFLGANTNKRGVTLDLTTAAGLHAVRGLISVSDIVLENFTPRVMDNFGLTWETIRELNSHAIYVRMPAFGLSGPWRDRTGFAQTMEQLTGLAWLTGYPDDQPRIQRGPSDPNAGMHAAFAALVALAERDATGDGQHVEVTMIEGALNAAAEQLVEWTAYGRLLEREGNRSPWAAPQNLYKCEADEEWLAVSVESDQQWLGLVEALGRPAWANEERWATHAGRRAGHDELDAHLGAWAAARKVQDAVDHLIAFGVPAAPAFDPRATAFHPQLRARGFCEEPDHPVVGRHATPTVPFRYASVPRWISRPAPTLGQHTREVLSELLGFDEAALDALEEAEVIGTWPRGL